MVRRGPKTEKLWSLHPELHDDVTQSLDGEGIQLYFFNADDEQSKIREWDTNIMGRFICRNKRCPSSGWSSKKVAVTIRMYPEQLYNARVYHQRCKKCNVIGRLILDHECYAERVTYWLKKWNGIQVRRPSSSSRASSGPHDSELCEGCRVGHCRDANDDIAWVMAG